MDDQNTRPDPFDNVEEEASGQAQVVTSGDQSQAIILTNLEGLIKGHITAIDKLSEEQKKNRETLESILLNDEIYIKHSEAAKEAAKVKSATRSEIMKRPSVMIVAQKLKEIKEQMKEMQMELSEYLQEYQRLANTNVIEGEDGQLREIVNTSKLIRTSVR